MLSLFSNFQNSYLIHQWHPPIRRASLIVLKVKVSKSIPHGPQTLVIEARVIRIGIPSLAWIVAKRSRHLIALTVIAPRIAFKFHSITIITQISAANNRVSIWSILAILVTEKEVVLQNQMNWKNKSSDTWNTRRICWCRFEWLISKEHSIVRISQNCLTREGCQAHKRCIRHSSSRDLPMWSTRLYLYLSVATIY